MEKIKKQAGMCMIIICLLLGVGIFYKNSLHAEAAGNYKELFKYYGNTTDKTGKYVLKLSGSTVYVKKSGRYVATPLPGYWVFANGKYAYYVKNRKLYRYTFSTGKAKVLKSFTAAKYDTYSYAISVSYVYGGKVYLRFSSFDKWMDWTYSYTVKNGKLKKEKSNCLIAAYYGKYVVGKNGFRTDTSPTGLTLYKITSKGLQKVRKLTNRGHSPMFKSGKVYYVSYPVKDSMKKAVLYRCSGKTGKSKKKLKTFTASGAYGQVYGEGKQNGFGISVINTTGEIKNYLFSFKTGKFKAVDSTAF